MFVMGSNLWHVAIFFFEEFICLFSKGKNGGGSWANNLIAIFHYV